jgi:hypothetical protein
MHTQFNEYLHNLSSEQIDQVNNDPNSATYFEQRDCFYTTNENGEFYMIDPTSLKVKRLEKLIHQLITADTLTVALFHMLKKELYPRYFSNYQQFLYALAITPLSQRPSLVKYYKSISPAVN